MSALIAGVTLGFAAGISPGPLLSLVITTALARGFAAGLRVALAPLLTDAPIILLTLFAVRSVPAWAQSLLAGAGGLFVIYLGIDILRSAGTVELLAEQPPPVRARADWGRGALVNLLSPHPWLFWIAVGSPLLVGLAGQSAAVAAAFLLAFYLFLIGSKVAVAAAVAGGRRRLTQRWYRRLLLLSGVLLIGFGLLLLLDALRSSGVLHL